MVLVLYFFVVVFWNFIMFWIVCGYDYFKYFCNYFFYLFFLVDVFKEIGLLFDIEICIKKM